MGKIDNKALEFARKMGRKLLQFRYGDNEQRHAIFTVDKIIEAYESARAEKTNELLDDLRDVVNEGELPDGTVIDMDASVGRWLEDLLIHYDYEKLREGSDIYPSADTSAVVATRKDARAESPTTIPHEAKEGAVCPSAFGGGTL